MFSSSVFLAMLAVYHGTKYHKLTFGHDSTINSYIKASIQIVTMSQIIPRAKNHQSRSRRWLHTPRLLFETSPLSRGSDLCFPLSLRIISSTALNTSRIYHVSTQAWSRTSLDCVNEPYSSAHLISAHCFLIQSWVLHYNSRLSYHIITWNDSRYNKINSIL